MYCLLNLHEHFFGFPYFLEGINIYTAGLTFLVIRFWQFIVFQYKFDLPQVKRGLISSTTYFVYKLSPKLPNDVISKDIRKYWENLKAEFG